MVAKMQMIQVFESMRIECREQNRDQGVHMTEASERDQNARPFVDLFPKRQTVAKHLSKVHLEVGGRDNGVMHRNELLSLAVQEKEGNKSLQGGNRSMHLYAFVLISRRSSHLSVYFFVLKCMFT